MFKCTVTGIGSLPHKNAEEAVDLVLNYCPQAPFWPQLPKKDAREGMCVQFSEHLPCLVVEDNELLYDARRQDAELEEFYKRVISEDVEYFAISPEFASGLYAFYRRLEKGALPELEFIKCHVTGPFTYAAGLKDDSGKALLHDTVFMQALIKGLAMKARWQIDLFRKFGKQVIVFMDEPYLAAFGSAYTTVNRDEVVQDLGEVAAAVKAAGGIAGVHCCGNTDWSMFTEIEAMGIINFDAFGYLDKLLLYAQDLKKFFDRGGVLCWGIAPTQEFDGNQGPEELVDKIKYGVEALVKKGIDRKVIWNNMLLSPACGLGTLTPDKAGQIFALLSHSQTLLLND